MASIFSKVENTESSPAILTRIAQADKSAAYECVELYGKMIWALVKQYTNSAAEAERIVPEIFMDIWRNARFCDLEISDEKVWIALIARRYLSGYVLKDNYHLSPETPQEVFTGDYGKVQKTMVIAH